MAKKNPYLLPENVRPIHYDLELTPDLEKFTFFGSEVIDLIVNKPTSKITLHAVDLKILRAEFEQYPFLSIAQISFNKEMETVTLQFDRKLRPEIPAKLFVRFTGELNNKMHGFYRTSYELNGQKHWGAATQFEATDARRCFPCWDEPAKKATFSVELRVPVGMTALSNMPASSFVTSENQERVTFEQTPVMSTYLLAFVVAELKCIEDKEKNGVPIKVWTTPGKEECGRFAMECAKHTLPYFGEWFGIPYALPKLDMVALPDFASGAMENWGLITYRETALLIDPRNSSQAARQRVAQVVDHELAHQWFGNLVTMKWWTDLWLNEGFASYMGPKAVDHQFPEWDAWTQYVADDYLSALNMDSLHNTHPIEIDVKNPYEIRETFDAITYAKGSVVNRMLEAYLGEDFQKGLRLYLKRHAYKNASTQDLWQALEEASGKPVRDIIARYTKQPGYPVVFVKGNWNSAEARGQALKLKLEQKRFLADGGKDSKNLLWKIPVGISTRNFPNNKLTIDNFLMNKQTYSTEISRYTLDQHWFKLNAEQSGFYRVAYSQELWKPLLAAVKRSEIPKIDRIGLLDDAWALSSAGYQRTSSALELTEALNYEKEFAVWLALFGNTATTMQISGLGTGWVGKLYNLLFEEEVKEKLGSFVQTLLRSHRQNQNSLLRALVLRNLGGYGDKKTIEEAKSRFSDFLHSGKIDPDLKQVIYQLVAENGDDGEFREFKKLYSATESSAEKTLLLRAFGCFQDKAVLKKVLEFSVSADVRAQDWAAIMIPLGLNPWARSLAWRFLKKNWRAIEKKYLAAKIGDIIEAIAGNFTTEKDAMDIKRFFEKHKTSGIERSVRQAIESININAKWLKRDKKDIKNWLANR